MSKFCWNLTGIALLDANIFAFMLCIATGEKLWGLALFALSVVDWLYKENRPTWLEV